MHITRDGGKTWNEISAGLPPGKFIAEIVASRYDEGTVYLVQNGKRDDDFAPYVWKSTDYGRTWTSLVNNLTSGPGNVIKEDHRNRSVLYLGTDQGAYASVDGGRTWNALTTGMPTAYVHDLAISENEDLLVAATHGRGMYALDLLPIQRTTAEVLAKPLHVYAPDPARIVRGGGFGAAPASAAIYYYVKAPGAVTATVRDANGGTVRELRGNASAGVNMLRWELGQAGPGVYSIEVRQGSASDVNIISVSR